MIGHTMAGGTITVIWGCMFSGKSERLVARLCAAQDVGREIVAFKHASDDRYCSRQIVTHGGRRFDAEPVPDIHKLLDRVGAASLVAIDEAQFFGPELIQACRELADQGRDVVVAGLDLDSWGQPFGPMPELAAVADELILATAVCACCGGVANRTQRLAPVLGQKLVGGSEAYEPRCGKCFEPPPAELRR